MKIAGRHLWSVGLSNKSSSLWITTTKRELEMVVKKANRFIKKNPDQYHNSIIHSITNHGTLDV